MAEDTRRRLPGRLVGWAPAALVLGLVVFHGIGNWIWLSKNVMTRGWDRIGALVNSLYYYETLSRVSYRTLFKAIIQDEYRPPLFGLSMATMYRLFGVSSDVAVMANVVYLAILVAASYGIGAKLGGRCLGMLSAMLVALIPLVFAMSRYSYYEFSLASLTVLSVYLMLASERFKKRGASIALGLSLGFGSWTTRTFPVFVFGPLTVFVLQAGLPRKLWARLRAKPRLRWRDLALAVGGGLLISALWYFPNRDTAQALSAGFWLFPVWWALAATTIWFVQHSSSPEAHFLACCSLALLVASLWYVPHVLEYAKQILWLAWGIQDPRNRAVDFTSLDTYTAYLQSFLYGFSPFFVGILALAWGMLLFSMIRRHRRALPERWWTWEWWAIIAGLAVVYLIFTTSIYKEPRAITPALPFLGVILAGALLALPWRRLRTALIVLTVVFGLVQFLAVSYTEAHGLVERTNFRKPLLGQPGLFSQGLYLEVPDSGLNDPRWYIAGDVLQRVDATRQREGWESISLGVLGSSSHIHVGQFAYDQRLRYPAIRPENPVQAYPEESAYAAAFRYDYLLVLDEGNRGPAMREAVNLILNERRAEFERSFELEKAYPLPDESHAYLFQRRSRP